MEPVVIGPCTLYNADCRDVLPLLEGGSVSAVVTDPPYHGVVGESWDNQWKTDAEFLQWVGEVSDLIEPSLAGNGSLYWFASPRMASRVEVELSKRFCVLNNLVWEKSRRKGAAGNGIDVTALRRFWSSNSERLIFCEKYGSDQAADDASGYTTQCESAKRSIIGDYLRAEFTRAGVTNREIAALFPSATGGLTGCVSNWLIGYNVPTPEQYDEMRRFLNSRNCRRDFLRREYEDLRREYEDLRREYEDLRRPFNLTARDEWGDVWQFPIERERVHPTQKPLSLVSHILKVSTRQGNSVLDPFMGSGTTGVACCRMGCQFIGVELDPQHFATACRRIRDAVNAEKSSLFPAIDVA